MSTILTTMHITINQQSTELPAGSSMADALARMTPPPQAPFAVAVNTVFVGRRAGGSGSEPVHDSACAGRCAHKATAARRYPAAV